MGIKRDSYVAILLGKYPEKATMQAELEESTTVGLHNFNVLD